MVLAAWTRGERRTILFRGGAMGFEVLLVANDPLAKLRPLLPSDAIAQVATTTSVAIATLRDLRRGCHVALVALKLGRDARAGLEVLEVAVLERPRAVCVLVAASADAATVERVTNLGAYIVRTPVAPARLDVLFARARPLPSPLERRAREWGLSPRQRAVVALLLEGRTREEIARDLGIADNTLRRHFQDILLRANTSSIDSLIIGLLRDEVADLKTGKLRGGVVRFRCIMH